MKTPDQPADALLPCPWRTENDGTPMGDFIGALALLKPYVGE